MTHPLSGFKLLDTDAPLLERLTPQHRAAITAAETFKGKYAQIAEALQVKDGTVKSRLNRARKALIALRPQKVQAA